MLTLDAGKAPAQAAALAAKRTERTERDLYDDAERENLQILARAGGVKAKAARSKLDNDAVERERRAARAEMPELFRTRTADLTASGYTGRGGGRMPHVERPTLFRDTTSQIVGLYPFSVGASAPLSGAPVGTHLETGQPVGCDPLSWFADGHITAPSATVLGLNGFGKSTLLRRWCLYYLATGIRPMVMGDLKPDFSPMFDTINELAVDSGEFDRPPLQVSRVGWNAGKLNPLAVGSFGGIIARLPGTARAAAEVELRRRQVTALSGLLEILGGLPLAPHEGTLLEAAIDVLYRTSNAFDLAHPPLPVDVLRVIKQAPAAFGAAVSLAASSQGSQGSKELIEASGALGRTSEISWDRYVELTERLRHCLDMIVSGPYAQMFNHHTTDPVDTSSRGVCVDISNVPAGDMKLRAAVLLTCWSDGFSAVEATHLLHDHGVVAQQSLFNLFIDEMSLVLGTGHGIVARVDEAVRVQRSQGTGTTFCTHTAADLVAFDRHEDRQRAMGFLERSRIKILFPLPRSEAKLIEGKVSLNDREITALSEWATATAANDDPVVDPATPEQWARGVRPGGADRVRRTPPGMGKFLIKRSEGELAGIPVQLRITPTEDRLKMHDTNRRFAQAFAGPRG